MFREFFFFVSQGCIEEGRLQKGNKTGGLDRRRGALEEPRDATETGHFTRGPNPADPSPRGRIRRKVRFWRSPNSISTTLVRPRRYDGSRWYL